jgi:hypothetical protein
MKGIVLALGLGFLMAITALFNVALNRETENRVHALEIDRLQASIREIVKENDALILASPGEQPENVKLIEELNSKMRELKFENQQLLKVTAKAGISPLAIMINDEIVNLKTQVEVLQSNVGRIHQRLSSLEAHEH